MRSRRRSALLVSIAFLSVLGGGGVAAAQAVPPVEIVGTDLTEFPTVRLSVAASGDAASSLDPAEIEITENGEPREAEVVPLSEEAIDVVLAIDISGSMAGEPLEQAKAAATDFLDELPAAARTAIVTFETTAELVSGLTADRAQSRDAVAGLSEAGGTALYDGMSLASQVVSGSDAARSAIVVLSDGADTSSGGSIDDAVAQLESIDTDFFAVSLQSGETDEVALNQLASAAGGRVVPATDPDALSEAYIDLGQRISNQFAVVFESQTEERTASFEITVAPTGDSDSVEVALPNRGSATPTTEAAQANIEPLMVQRQTGPLERNWAIWLGAGLIAVALAVTAYAVAPEPGTRPKRRSLRSDREVSPDAGAGERILTSVRGAATRLGSRAVERSERTGVIDASLDRAGIVMRAGEFVALVFGVAVVSAVVLYLVMGLVGLALGVFVPVLGAPTFLRIMARRRNAKFADQLGDTLMLMAGSLRSGFGAGAAIDSVAQEMEAPIGVEFQRATLEIRLGRDMEDALESVAKRVQNEDFEWVVDAMRIHHQVGGDLAQILDQVSETIRGRNRLRRQIAALTAEGRMSAVVLGALPIGMGLVLWTSNPDYLRPLFSRTGGQLMLAMAVVLLVTGAIWLKKLIDVEL